MMAEPLSTGVGCHDADRVILIGAVQSAARPSSKVMRLCLDPHQRADWLILAKRFTAEAVQYSSTTLSVFVDPACENWPETAAVIAHVRAHYQQAEIAQNTVEVSAERMGRNFVANLVRMAEQRRERPSELVGDAAQAYYPLLKDRTVVVVGAGPSLEDHVSILADYPGPVIAVNTSAPALCEPGGSGGRGADIVVCMESQRLAQSIASVAPRGMLALDLTAHPDNTGLVGEPAATHMFVGSEPNLVPYAQRCGMLPLAYGTSCTTAAVALALGCGAERVLLVGQDCALTPAGRACFRMYARGTPYAGTLVTFEPGSARATVAKPMGRDIEVHQVDVVAAGGIDGKPVFTTPGLLGFAQWFGAQPAEVRRRIINCTGHGVRLERIAHEDFAACVRKYRPERATGVVPRPPLAIQRDRARKTVAHLANIASHVSKMKDAQLLEWSARHPIFAMWVAPELLRQKREPELSRSERGHRKAEVVRRAAREICGIVVSADGVPEQE